MPPHSKAMKDSMDRILQKLIDLQQKPEPFTPGEALFWDDPHISSQLLALHLDPDIEAASRKPETIDRSVDWLTETLELEAGASLLDLGCGPGLYASRFAQAGFHVTGVDYSRRSIEYAKEYASKNGLNIAYRYQDYLGITDENRHDAAFLIYGDFCVLSPEDRSTLLKSIHRALKLDGHFVFDVSTREVRKRFGNKNGWYATEGGFWKVGPHLVLEEGFDYPEHSIWLDQYTVIAADGKVSVYRNWFQDYTPETITEELSRGRFSVVSLWADLTGLPYFPDSEWIGVIAKRS
jgi:SAM-dependent methyltransferase